jgi:DNA polymerase-3 subunit delta
VTGSPDLEAPVHLLRGDDPVLLADTVVDVIDALVGDGDRSLVLEELDAARFDTDSGRSLSALVDAAATPPFLTDTRVVVGRQLGAFTKVGDVEALLAYLADPLPTTRLVLAWEPHPGSGIRSGSPPKKLIDAVKAIGVVIDTSAGTGKSLTSWVDDRLKGAPVKLDAGARRLIADQIGDDASRLVGLLPVFESVFGPGAKLGAADIEPYLGGEGSVKPWDLTDAIDKGDAAKSLQMLHRMQTAGLHSLQVMASLTNHYGRMAALDGTGVPDERAAAEVLGIKGSTFPAKKALTQARKLGSDRLREFTRLLADADLDTRGASSLPDDVVMEVLVARLASRSRR